MHRTIPFQLVSVLLVFSCFMWSCGPTKSYFKTPNDVLKMPATVTMANGTLKTGLLTILFENDLETSGSLISFIPADSNKEVKLNFSNIRSYKLNGSTYEAKFINLSGNGTFRGLFMKRLSSDTSILGLYQLEQRYKSNAVGEDRDYYYISIPTYSTTKLIELQSSLLVPSFESKMAAYVKDCPQLVTKIVSGEKGYTYSFLTATFKKVEIMQRIIAEYDKCEKGK